MNNIQLDLPYPWWVKLLIVIGGFTTVTSFVTLFMTFGRRPHELKTTATPPVDSDEFHMAVAGLVNAPLRQGGEAQLLNNGNAFFPAILDAIRGAQRTINLMVYIWEPGSVSRMFTDALVERARAGVQVRVLLDGLGGLRAPLGEMKEIEDAGGRVERFRPPVPGKFMRFHKRNHRRSIVIDGRIGFTGGAAIGDKWLGDADSERHWRDTMVRVTGWLAVNLQAAFAELWTGTCGEVLVGPDYYVRDDEIVEGQELARHINVVSSPSSEEHPLRYVFMLSFASAASKIYISSSYFVPDKHLRALLASRARCGLDVRILVPNELTDAKPIRWAGRSYYDELLSGGVRVFEYQPTMFHVKALVVDGIWSIIGSANMDVRSKELNEENVLAIADRRFAAQVEQTFLDDLKRAREIKLDEWRKRPFRERVVERFWVLFAEQY